MFIEQYKNAFYIRKVEESFLDLFKKGKISGTVHTCVGQEFTGIFAAKNSIKGDFVVSNHRGHGHYLSFTKDLRGLIGELLGKKSGCSKGIGGSQHLINDNFLSNGIQGGMLPIAAGVALRNKFEKNHFISIAFLGDGTLGQGIVYETFNIASLWSLPVVFILEKNNISQSTSFEQNFSGNIKDRINGFGLKYFNCSIYDIENMSQTFEKSFNYARNYSKPVFIEVEVARLNSHSKGDDNRDDAMIGLINQKDPLNVFLSNNEELKSSWENEFNELIQNEIKFIEKDSRFDITPNSNIDNENIIGKWNKINLSKNNEKRFNELINIELANILKNHNQSIFIGEDIENNNSYNPKEYGGAFKVSRNLSNMFPDKVINTPISEQAITGIGIGLAFVGYISIVEIMFGDFTTLIFDQILQHASKFVTMYGREIKLPIIIRTPMGAYRGYGPTHSQSIEKHFLGINGLNVIALNQLLDPSIVFDKIISSGKPTLLIENKILYTKKLYENICNGYELEICEINDSFPVVRLYTPNEIPSVTIISYGGVVTEILDAMEKLFFENEIIVDLFVVSDLNNSKIPLLLESLSVTNNLCLVEEGNSFASFSSEVLTNIFENGLKNFSFIKISNNLTIPSSRELESIVLPTSSKIVKTILKLIENE
jgi:2-oxoisovalerate dehydrogenase E1 component